MPAPSLDHVILTWPKNLSDTAEVKPSGKSRSWIQLARTGSFTSNRYGKFSITKQDLSSMLHNFANITPKSPTELPIDYDHLSMDPKKPGDGIAAGWMKRLELRGDGDELWAEVEWTPSGAERVERGEYRFISPSFVKDHTHKDGQKIGTTLLAAAVTNHPFLEGMNAISLANASVFGDLAFNLAADGAVVSLSEVGQRVMVAPGNARTHDEVGGTFEVSEVVGDGDDAFIAMKDVNGVVHKWFRATELLPAMATPQGLTPPPNLQPGGLPPRVDAKPPVPAVPGVAAVPGTDPAAPGVPGAAVPGAVPVPGAPGAPDAVKPGDEPAPPHPGVAAAAAAPGVAEGEMETEGAEGVEPEDGAGAPPWGQKSAKAATEDPEVTQDGGALDALKKAKAALGAVSKKGITHMSTMYSLRNDKNEEITVSAEQLAQAGITVVPEGASVIGTEELAQLKGTLTNLSSRVEDLAALAGAAQQDKTKAQMTARLSDMSQRGLITRPQREFALSTWGDATDLAQFNAWAATFTRPIVSLGAETGHGDAETVETDGAKAATDRLISLADSYVREQGMTSRDAMIKASQDLPEDADAYRLSFAQ